MAVRHIFQVKNRVLQIQFILVPGLFKIVQFVSFVLSWYFTWLVSADNLTDSTVLLNSNAKGQQEITSNLLESNTFVALTAKGEMLLTRFWFLVPHLLSNVQTLQKYLLNSLVYVFFRKIEVTFLCPMDFHNFPLDTQTCPIQIESYGFLMDTLHLSWKNGTTVTTFRSIQ